MEGLEEGHNRGLPANGLATDIANATHDGPPFSIVGNALLCAAREFEVPDDEDEDG